MKIVRVSRILGFVVVLSFITLFAGCGGGGGSVGDTKGGGEEITIPVITSQPDHQVVPLGGQAVFTVAATGGGLSYQWESSDDKGRSWNPISGATAASCSIPTSEQTPALFRCAVTNTAGSVTSDIAELAVVIVVFVDKDAAAGGDGTSWETAYSSLQDALNDPSDCEIWVAAGTYTPTTGIDQSATFTLVSGVAVYGGFASSETCRQARDWKTNVTTLSGDIGSKGDASDNCYHVVTGTTGAKLDGFTISAGNANNYNNNWGYGGGMYNENSNPTVTNCAFSGNYAGHQGGGMYNLNSSPIVTNCAFSGNCAYDRGGGMANRDSSATVTNCTFSGNSAPNTGGGMFNYYSSATVTSCTFSGNSASQGGGMYNWSTSTTVTSCAFSGNSATESGGGMANRNSSPAMINCIFSGNSAPSGGAIANSGSSPTVTNCTFSGNSVTNYGGAIGNFYGSNPTLQNSILWGNTARTGPQIYDENSTTTITHSCIQGGYAGDGNIISDPLLNVDDPSSDDYLTLQAGSPCINAGDNSAVPSGITTDLAGNPRISGSTVDMGAYEYQQ